MFLFDVAPFRGTVMQDMEERMDAYFGLLGQLSRNTAKLSSKVRFACRDVMQCRESRWVCSVAHVEKYKTADEVRKRESLGAGEVLVPVLVRHTRRRRCGLVWCFCDD